jgi:hypothetical protein
MKRLSFLHPFFFAVSSVFIFYLDKSAIRIYISPSDVIVPSLCAIVACLLLIAIVYLVTRRAEVTGIIATLFILGLSYLWLHYFAILSTALFGVLLTKIVLKKTRFEEVNFILSILSISVFGYYLYQFISFVADQSGRTHFVFSTAALDSQVAKESSNHSPDIYFIILDGYGRADMLKMIFNYNNSAFIAELEQRGFVVPPRSQANYPGTLLSLSSSLNMQYLDSMSAALGNSNLWWPAQDAIHHSLARSFLERAGYQTVFLSSGWDFTDIRDGDEYLKAYPFMLRDFTRDFINTTNLRIFEGVDQFGIYTPSYDTYRHVILFNFDILPEVAELPGPKFVFSHIISPHPPYVFNSRGEPVDEKISYTFFERPNLSDDKTSYLEQLTFVNQKTLEMIDGILTHSKTPPIIIILGDHGPNLYLNLEDMSQTCLYERFSNLSAFYLPGADKSVVPDNVTPVNVFRLIFNQYFETNYEMLPNRNYFMSNAAPYQFDDITGLTQSQCIIPDASLP